MALQFRIPLTGPDSEDPKLAARPATKLKVKKQTPNSEVLYEQAPADLAGDPFVVPNDIVKKLLIHDRRTINPATGQPFKVKEPKSAKVDPSTLKAIISHAKAKGVDPFTALAISQQESEFGAIGNLGEVNDYQPDADVYSNLDRGANVLAKALKDKLEYAKRLGYDKKGLDYALQAYNGYGNGMAQNPTYGKVVVSLLNNLKNDPEIQRMVQETPAYGKSASGLAEAAGNKVMLRIAKK